MKKTPLALVKERFESKEKLLAAVQKLATDDLWLDRVNETKGLARVSNEKLLRLHDTLSDAKKRFGSREKLIQAILTSEKRAKDAGYKARLEQYPLPRLLDMQRAGERRANRAAAAAKAKPAKQAPPKKKVARSKKAKAKAKAA